MPNASEKTRVVIVGGGFAGLAAARVLRGADARITLIDRRNHHVFQPLLYQVATAALSPAQIAVPIRRLFRRDRNVRVVMAAAECIDTATKTVETNVGGFGYDWLIVAAGARYTYFGNESWREHAPGLKSIEDALEVRRRFLLCYERAEHEPDDDARRALMTFVIIGGGPTGVELAGALAEIATQSLPTDFRHADTTRTRILLVEAEDRLLLAFDEGQSARAKRDLESLGVEVRLNTMATDVRRSSVELKTDASGERVECGAVFWAAGIEAEPVAADLGQRHARDGRIEVGPDLSVPGHPEVFAVGDIARMVGEGGREVPGVAQGAMQSGRHAARIVRDELVSGARASEDRPAFRYRDKGTLATIGRRRAIADLGWIKLAGLPAWLLWGGVHVLFLIGFRNKLLTMAEWIWAYVTFGRGARLITGADKAVGRGEKDEA